MASGIVIPALLRQGFGGKKKEKEKKREFAELLKFT
jgi:hypothetical protein